MADDPDDVSQSEDVHPSDATTPSTGADTSLSQLFESFDGTAGESEPSDEITVDVSVSGIELDETQQHVVDTYAENIETFIRKNNDYGSSFTDSAKIESILKYGEIRSDEVPELVSRQIFVRGMLDKISRFYQLAFEQDGQLVGDEAVDDTLLDLGNYSVMLASRLRAAEADE